MYCPPKFDSLLPSCPFKLFFTPLMPVVVNVEQVTVSYVRFSLTADFKLTQYVCSSL